jgi:hypothetical protein
LGRIPLPGSFCEVCPGVRNQPPPPRQEAALDNVLVNGVEIGPLRLFEPVEGGLWVLDFLQGSLTVTLDAS